MAALIIRIVETRSTLNKSMNKTKQMTKILYKLIGENKTKNGHKWIVGKWYKHDGELKLCDQGFHASEKIIDAMNYVIPYYVAKVEVRGESQVGYDKEVWSEMKIVKMKKWTKKDSLRLAIKSAEDILPIFEKEYPKDDQPRKSIAAAKAVLKHDTEKNRVAAAWTAGAEWASPLPSARAAERAAARAAAGAAARPSAWTARVARTVGAAMLAIEAGGPEEKEKLHNFIIKMKEL